VLQSAAYLPSYHIAWKMPIPFPLRIRTIKQGRVGKGSFSNHGKHAGCHQPNAPGE